MPSPLSDNTLSARPPSLTSGEFKVRTSDLHDTPLAVALSLPCSQALMTAYKQWSALPCLSSLICCRVVVLSPNPVPIFSHLSLALRTAEKIVLMLPVSAIREEDRHSPPIKCYIYHCSREDHVDYLARYLYSMITNG